MNAEIVGCEAGGGNLLSSLVPLPQTVCGGVVTHSCKSILIKAEARQRAANILPSQTDAYTSRRTEGWLASLWSSQTLDRLPSCWQRVGRETSVRIFDRPQNSPASWPAGVSTHLSGSWDNRTRGQWWRHQGWACWKSLDAGGSGLLPSDLRGLHFITQSGQTVHQR